MKKEIKREFYCRECGTKLIAIDMQASNIEVNRYDSGGGHWWRLASPFSDFGGVNMAKVFKCPSYKKQFFFENPHDIFAIYKYETYHGIRII